MVPGAARSASNVDTRDAQGGGERRGPIQATVLLYASADPVSLTDAVLNNLAANQTQRIRTAEDRATQENRRATPNPMDEVFLASGTTGHEERRALSQEDAAHGAPDGAQPHPDGSRSAASAVAGGDQLRIDPAPLGSKAVTPKGVLGGKGKRHQRAAKVAYGRPDLDRGPAATQSVRTADRVRDDLDAELLAAKLQRSLVESSVRGHSGQRDGLGGDAPGRGSGARSGEARGGKASPYTPGAGTDGALDTRDGRYVRWFAQQRARVTDALVFPLNRALLKDQGTSLYRVVVRRDGRLESPPRLLRSSGFADLDAAAVAAIRKAAPFAPFPDRLAPELARIQLDMPVEFANPMFQ